MQSPVEELATHASGIEHTVGVYLGLMILACLVGVIAKRITHLPYTIFLTLVGLAVGYFHLGPSPEEFGFGHELIFFVFLPPLLFQGAFHVELNRLLKNIWPILTFSIPGVILSTVICGLLFGWTTGIGIGMIAMLFGALISPTDPVSVLALFKEVGAPEDLKIMVEGESLFNDATGVVVFGIIFTALMTGTDLNVANAVLEFVKVSGGGIIIGLFCGLIAFWFLHNHDDHLLENAICLCLAYGSFWLAESMHLSGVIATVAAAILIGNHGKRFSMSQKTTETVETFFESIDFLLNSMLFILIGLELKELPSKLPEGITAFALASGAILAMLIARAVVSYVFYWLSNQVGTIRPKKWKHIIFWGGLRGSIPIALLLHLPLDASTESGMLLVEYRPALILAGFACVAFSLIVQGTTMKPLMKKLKIQAEIPAGH